VPDSREHGAGEPVPALYGHRGGARPVRDGERVRGAGVRLRGRPRRNSLMLELCPIMPKNSLEMAPKSPDDAANCYHTLPNALKSPLNAPQSPKNAKIPSKMPKFPAYSVWPYSAVATYVSPERRAGSLTFLFAFFNCGSAFGLLLAGGLLAHLGWPSVFLAFGGVGVLWSVSGYLALPPAAKLTRLQRNPAAVAVAVKLTSVDERVNTAVAIKTEGEAGLGEGVKGEAGVSDGVEVGRGTTDKGWLNLPGWMYPQLFSLAWCHICINWVRRCRLTL